LHKFLRPVSWLQLALIGLVLLLLGGLAGTTYHTRLERRQAQEALELARAERIERYLKEAAEKEAQADRTPGQEAIQTLIEARAPRPPPPEPAPPAAGKIGLARARCSLESGKEYCLPRGGGGARREFQEVQAQLGAATRIGAGERRRLLADAYHWEGASWEGD